MHGQDIFVHFFAILSLGYCVCEIIVFSHFFFFALCVNLCAYCFAMDSHPIQDIFLSYVHFSLELP